MDWPALLSLGLLALAVAVGLVLVLYTSVSRYAKRFDPAETSAAEAAPERDDPP